MPVLATIPKIWLESDRLSQRRSTIRQVFATAALVMFAVVGGAANYLWVNGGGIPDEVVSPQATEAAASPGTGGN